MKWTLLLLGLPTASRACYQSNRRHWSRLDNAPPPAETSAAVAAAVRPRILPARLPLPSFLPSANNNNNNNNAPPSFSVLSWNILLPNSRDNWWCHKQYAANVDMSKRTWSHRRTLIRKRLVDAMADVVCIQEADGETFDDDFDFMKELGYDVVLHNKFRFRCATFYQRSKFVCTREAHKDRTLVTTLVWKRNDDIHLPSTMIKCPDFVQHVVNCHLSGGAAPERRLRQVHDGLEQIRKWNNALERDILTQQRTNKGRKNRQKPTLSSSSSSSEDAEESTERTLSGYRNAGILVCGDFNSDGNTAVRKLLVEGCVDPDWREPQYPNLRLTSRRLEHVFGPLIDAAEIAYGSNVCDGDYAEAHSLGPGAPRPATYVVPNLASLLVVPMTSGDGGDECTTTPPRTEFGIQIARGLAETLNLSDFCKRELDRAFELVDSDGNGRIDEGEVSTLLENVYVATYGQQIEQERNNFFRGFGTKSHRGVNDEVESAGGGLTKEQFITRLKALQNDTEGERKAFGLAKGLNLKSMSEVEMEQSFDRIDLDRNGLLEEDEFQTLLENVYVTIYGEEIKRKRDEFFSGFRQTGVDVNFHSVADGWNLTREQFTERLLALHQELDGGRVGSELAEVNTEADVDVMIKRFTPLLNVALDKLFDKFSSNGVTLTQDEVNEFLIKTNGELGRGGTYRHTYSIFQKKAESLTGSGLSAELTRHDWYGVFARELAKGKWWQVVYDLEICGFDVRSYCSNNVRGNNDYKFYQGWLDYIFSSRQLTCTGVQDGLTEAERLLVYNDGDALPNEWHPSDHIPVAAIFSWT